MTVDRCTGGRAQLARQGWVDFKHASLTKEASRATGGSWESRGQRCCPVTACVEDMFESVPRLEFAFVLTQSAVLLAPSLSLLLASFSLTHSVFISLTSLVRRSVRSFPHFLRLSLFSVDQPPAHSTSFHSLGSRSHNPTSCLQLTALCPTVGPSCLVSILPWPRLAMRSFHETPPHLLKT